jgi:hypothetical protein
VVGAQFLQLGDWGDSVENSEWLQFQAVPPTGSAMAISREGPVLITDGQITTPASPLGFAGNKLSAVAPDFDSQLFAGVTTDRTRLLIGRPGNSRPILLDFDEQLSAPRFDRFGWVWVVGSQGVWVVNAFAESPEPKLVGGLPAGLTVSSIAPSIDGVRVLLRVQDFVQSFAALAAISRGEEIALTGLQRVDRDLGIIISTGWLDANRVALLHETGGNREIVSFDLRTGQSISLGTPPGPSNLGASVGRPILVGSELNEIFEQSPAGWQSIGAASAPIYPG